MRAAARLLRPSERTLELALQVRLRREERSATLERLRDGQRGDGAGVRSDQGLEFSLQPAGRFEFPHSSLMWRHSDPLSLLANDRARSPRPRASSRPRPAAQPRQTTPNAPKARDRRSTEKRQAARRSSARLRVSRSMARYLTPDHRPLPPTVRPAGVPAPRGTDSAGSRPPPRVVGPLERGHSRLR